MIPKGAYLSNFNTLEDSEIWQTPMQRRLAQIGRGNLKGMFYVYSGANMIAGYRYANRSLLGAGVIPPPYSAFGFSLSPEDSNLSGKAVPKGTVAFASSDQEFVAVYPCDFSQYYVLLDDSAIQKYLCEEDHKLYTELKHTLMIATLQNHTISSEIVKRIDLFETYLEHKQIVTTDDLVSRDFEYHVINSILTLHTDSRMYADRINKRSRALSRALEFLLDGDLTTITVADVVIASCTGQRSLEIAFKTILGHTIKSFLVKCRLNAVRQELICPTKDMRIRDVAMKYGVLHIGKFIASYRSLFGETPGQTLSRSKQHLN